MSESDRPMTPYDPFFRSSSSKMPAAKPTTAPVTTVDHFAGLPTIPRSPLVPPDLARASLGDTDHDEITPVSTKEDTLDMVLRKLIKLEQCQRDARESNNRVYDLVLKIDHDNKTERVKRIALARRIRVLEVMHLWLPLIALAVSVAALFRAYR